MRRSRAASPTCATRSGAFNCSSTGCSHPSFVPRPPIRRLRMLTLLSMCSIAKARVGDRIRGDATSLIRQPVYAPGIIVSYE